MANNEENYCGTLTPNLVNYEKLDSCEVPLVLRGKFFKTVSCEKVNEFQKIKARCIGCNQLRSCFLTSTSNQARHLRVRRRRHL